MISFSVTTKLLPHQLAAVEKLKLSRVGALFMEMGTGKTRTAFELVFMRQAKIGRVVYFCPVSLRYAVLAEIMRHTNVQVNEVCILKSGLDDVFEQSKASWYICGIESISSSDRMFLAIRKKITSDTYVIVDESTYIKGYMAKRTERIIEMSEKSRYRLLMTGTPLTQGIVDLYSQMKFLSEQILGYKSFYTFQRMHIKYSDKFPGLIEGYRHADWIVARIQPYVYQVLKKECLELPEKTYRVIYFSMSNEQSFLYTSVKEDILDNMMQLELSNGSKMLLLIFKMFTQLQQVTCGYLNNNGILKEIENNRLDVLSNILTDWGNEKVVIWAKDIYSIAKISNLLKDKCVVITGDISPSKRQLAIADFANKTQYMVATPSCAGHGFTFNMAHKMIFYNDGFKYSERIQAEDRIHRIGQHLQCEYVSIVCRDSIDERIQHALSCKEDALQAFRNEIEQIRDKKGRFSKEKLKELFNRI